MKYKEWLITWLKLYVKPVVKERTYDRYSQICNKNVIPLLGGYSLCELSSVVATICCGYWKWCKQAKKIVCKHNKLYYNCYSKVT